MKPVIFPLKLQMKRAEVGDLHQALSALGFSIANTEKKNRRFGASTGAAVREFQLAHQLPETGAVDEATAKAINQELADHGVLDVEPGPGDGEVLSPNPPGEGPQSNKFYLVTGRVLQATGPPVAGVEVHALHKNLRSEIALGTPALSDDLGGFRIRYIPPNKVKQVDLIVRAVRPQTEAPLAQSEVICHARRIEVVNLVVGGDEYRGYCEYERVSRAVQPHLDGIKMSDVTVADIELLECKAQQPPLHIAYLVIASRYAQRSEVPAAAYYGFFRMQLPTQLPKLVSQSIQVQRQALTDALAANIIPSALKDDRDKILQQLRQTAVHLALEVPEGKENTSLAPLLSTTGLSSAQQSALLTRYSLHQGTIQEFWAGLKTDQDLGQPELVERLQFTLQLGTLASGYVPFVQTLQAHLQAGQLKSVQDLAVLQPQDWLALVKQAGTPPGTPGETEHEREEYYAKNLAQTIERSFPTATVVAGLKRKNLPTQEELVRFLTNNPDFTFETNIDRYLASKNGGVTSSTRDVATLTQQLKQQQRVYNVSPATGKFSAMSTLLDAGLDSAQAIVHTGHHVFVKSLSGLLGGEAIANEIYDNAAQTNAEALSVFGQYSMALNIGTPVVIRNHTAQGANIPNWQALFGSLNFCECEHCRSVYSPAAYFVDLLQFVKQQNALDLLFARRSDLGEIQLSCQNTNTLLPYIDLVNEVLENAVVRHETIYQTSWTAEELSANPEHQNETPYQRLANQVYPRLLPFNLWLQETRAYLGHLGTSLVELMEVFHRPGLTGAARADLERQIAIESLGLSPVAAQIITNTLRPSRSAWEFWGWEVEPTDWPQVLADLSTFLRRAEIEHVTLEALRKTAFINADEKLTVTFITPCNTEGATINNLTEPRLDKIHRFLRLQHTVGWEITEVDAALTAMHATDLTMEFLVQLAQMQQLKAELNRPVLEMLSWWSTMSTVVDGTDPEDRSFYDELFLNNAVVTPADDAFQLNSTRSDLLNAGTAPLAEHTATVLAALAITEAELALILSATGKTEAEGLTLALLSELYRHASLARALGLSIADFLSLRKLTGIDPFTTPNATVDFVAEVQTVDQSPFSIATLDYLLRHVYSETSGLAPTESSITLVLDSIKAGLQAIAAENVLTPDPTGQITQGRLALLLADDILQQAIALIEGASTLTQTEQEAFIDEHFLIFFGDTTEAKVVLTQSVDPDHAALQKQARYEYVLRPLVTYLSRSLSTQFVVQTVAVALSLESAVAEAVLAEYITAPNDSSKKAIDIFLGIDLNATTYTDSEFNIYRLLHKVATVLTALKVTAQELPWVFAKGPARGWLDLRRLPLTIPSDTDAALQYAGWKRLVALYSFRDAYPAAGDVTVFSVFDLVDTGSDRDGVFATLSSLTGWDTLDMDYLTAASGFNLTYPDDCHDERYLVQLQAAFALLLRLGVSAEEALRWKTSTNLERMKAIAMAIKNVVKAKYDNDTWLTIAEPLKSQLREQQRSALIAHLIARRPGIEEASDLFAHYLIDVEMNSCMKTSRIKQAISSVQLFVQHCLMNLEPGVEISEVSAKQWEWMRNYRVWEANRKIFLYPENWIVPELRDDKSPFFKELENELLQNELTQSTAETALTHYLEKLDEVAKLDVRAMYHQQEGGEAPIDVLHVFARTQATPHVYYYRTYLDSAYWTPWEKIDIDIEEDHLLAVVWNRRLYLLWPLIEEDNRGSETCPPLSQLFEEEFPRLLNDENVDAWEELKSGWMDPVYEPELEEGLAAQETDLVEQTAWLENYFALSFPDISFEDRIGSLLQQWEACRTTENRISTIRLAWTERKDGTWAAEKVSEGSVTVQYREKESFLLKAEIEQAGLFSFPLSTGVSPRISTPLPSNELVIAVYSSDGLNKSLHGNFRFTGCNGQVIATASEEESLSLAHLFPVTLSSINMQYVEGETYDVPLTLPSSTVDSAGNWTGNLSIDYLTALNKNPGQFILTPPHQYNEYVSQDALFYQDATRCFYVTPQKQSPLYSVLQSPDAVYFEAALRSTRTSIASTLSKQAILIDAVLPSGPQSVARTIANRDPGRQLSQTIVTGEEVLIKDLLDQSSVAANGLVVSSIHVGSAVVVEPEKVYRFTSFYHPHICTFFKELNAKGVDGLMQRAVQARSSTFFATTYDPDENVVAQPYPLSSVDFSHAGAYSPYNWEIFFHTPLLIATRLSQNQRFEEAQRWFHYIFNPTARVDGATITGPERYWNFLPFSEENTPQAIDELMLALNGGDAELETQVEAWRETPFNPHLIARMRPVAYMKTVVMKYLDNLLAWGDSLFRQDTIESINTATQLYVLAADILGARPQSLPADTGEDSETYNSLANKLDDFSNALVQLENQMAARTAPGFDPFDNTVEIPPFTLPRPEPVPLPGVNTLYFCVPKNDELCAYWDTVADRLFKIRNCMNIEGVVRQLALFEPPINPALLVQATAAGIDISSVLSDLYAPLPQYRFQVMSQKAVEFCADVRALGAALLPALEKQDAEALALLRARQEQELLESMTQVRKHQIEDAKETLDGLKRTQAMIDVRHAYYQQLLSGGLNPQEFLNLLHLNLGRAFESKAGDYELRAARNYRIPDVSLSFSSKPILFPIPESVSVGSSMGGSFLGRVAQARAAKQQNFASNESFQANLASITAGHERRQQEWQHQVELAEKELEQIDKQIAAAQIRVAIAEQELSNHTQQIENAQAVHDFMKNKYTTNQLYSWMVSQISSIYFQSYQMAYNLAKRAEKAYQHELGVTTSNFISFGYWDSLKKGLLSGEKLQYDLRRMEMSYLEQNKREYELTKHISLAMLDPVALLKLQTEGECHFSLPEVVFDFDFPGQYLRRIKSVGVSIPCVTGPYTTVSANLTLLSNRVRRETTATGDYTYTGLEDSRFQHNVGAIQSIAVSSGQQDSGLFELNFRDERYLPFEGSGVISDWKLKLTSAVPTFDWSTITDIVLHVRYTAREGGDLLRDAALKALQSELEGIPLQRAFSALHEFPTEWNAFLRLETEGEAVLKLDLSEKRFPYFARGLEPTISRIELVALVKSPSTWTATDVTVEGGERTENVTLASAGNLYGGNPNGVVNYQGVSPGAWTVRVNTTSLGPPSGWVDDFVVIATYQVTTPT